MAMRAGTAIDESDMAAMGRTVARVAFMSRTTTLADSENNSLERER
jgi:hypothetical protein